jgi:hypothetical protein
MVRSATFPLRSVMAVTDIPCAFSQLAYGLYHRYESGQEQKIFLFSKIFTWDMAYQVARSVGTGLKRRGVIPTTHLQLPQGRI